MEAAASADSLSPWQLLVTSATPTFTLCLLAAVGALLAHKGVLDNAGCQLLAKLAFYVYASALTFAKIVQAVSISSITHLWPLVANMTVAVLLGLSLGVLAARLLRPPPEFRTHIIVAAAFGNVGNLPLVFVSTLCHDKQALFYRTLGDNCEQLGIAYTAFDIAAATLWQFTVAINLIRRGQAAAAAAAALNGTAAVGGQQNLPGSPKELRKRPTVSDLLRSGRSGSRPGSADSSPGRQQLRGTNQQQQQQQHSSPLSFPAVSLSWHQRPQQHYERNYEQQQQQHYEQQQQGSVSVELQPTGMAQPPAPPASWHLHAGQQQPLQGTDHHHHQQHQHQQLNDSPHHVLADEDTATLLPGGSNTTEGNGSDDRSAVGGAAGSSASSWPVRACRAAWQHVRAVDWGTLFPLPSQAAILGIVVGCIPALKGLLYGPRPPLRVLSETFDALGAGMIPATVPLLGAVLYRAPRVSRMPRRAILALLALKLVIQPAILTLLVVAALALGIFTPPDPMFLLTLLLSNATPTAINMQTLMVLFQYGEAEMSTILQWQYLASVLTLPAYMWVFLKIIAAWV